MKKKIITIITCILIVATLTTIGCVFAGCDNGKGTIVVGYTIYEPMNYFDGKDLIGFDTDLAKAVFADLGYNVVFKEITWENKYIDLNADTINCIWNGFTSSGNDDGQDRRTLVDFSYDYMKNYQAVVVKASEVSKFTDINTSFVGKVGYAEEGSAGEEYMAEFTGAITNTATTQMNAILQVNTNAASFAVVDYLLAQSIIGKGDYSDLAFVPALNSEEEYYGIGFKCGSELTAKVNETLEKFAASGKLAEIAATYGLSNTVVTDFSSQKK